MALVEKISCVYKIENAVTGDMYIGSTIDVVKRWRSHKSDLNSSRHHSRYLQNAWNKYGEENFVFTILVISDSVTIRLYEQLLLDRLNPVYNTVKNVEKPRLGYKYTEEEKLRMSKQRKGKKKSLETIRRMTISSRIRGERLSKFWGCIINPDGDLVGPIKNLRQFCIKHGLHYQHMAEVFQGKAKSHAGWHLPEVSLEKRKYAFISPNGTLFEDIDNVANFSKIQGFEGKSGFIALSSGRRKTYNGWIAAENLENIPRYTFKSPEGDEFDNIINISKFARKIGIIPQGLNKVANGIRKSIHGWTLVRRDYGSS